jgi:hypothetical protein
MKCHFLLNLLITVLFLATVAFCIWASWVVYLLGMLYIGGEYFILLGGTLFWLNKRKEEHFEETGTLRNIIGVTARTLFACGVGVMWVLSTMETTYGSYVVFRYWVQDDHFLASVIIRFLYFSMLIQAIHELVMYERLMGILVVRYPFLCRIIKNAVLYVKRSAINVQ